MKLDCDIKVRQVASGYLEVMCAVVIILNEGLKQQDESNKVGLAMTCWRDNVD